MVLIPPDAGLRMRLDSEVLPQQTRPVAPVKEITADLPRLQAGQNFTAQIRDVLPQNTYLALVAGKQVTLSLQANVKSGDVLELVVVEQTPRNIIAKLADGRAAAGAQQAGDPPQTTWSNTARMLRSLLVAEGDTLKSAPLNHGQPLLARPTGDGAALAPVLRQAVAQSGLFYEAHQAQWVAGKRPLAQLKQEPQGQQPAAARAGTTAQAAQTGQAAQTAQAAAGQASAQAAAAGLRGAGGTAGSATPSAAAGASAENATQPASQPAAGQSMNAANLANAANATALRSLLLYQSNQQQGAGSATGANAGHPAQGASPSAASAAQPQSPATAMPQAAALPHAAALLTEASAEAARVQGMPQAANLSNLPTMPDELRALVQQQLDAAGSQRLLWHGEVWPGQEMDWQVEWQGEENASAAQEEDEPWQTHLRLTTPRLGRVEAALHLGPSGVRLELAALDTATTARLRTAVEDLSQALAAAGVPLRGFQVRQAQPAEDVEPAENVG